MNAEALAREALEDMLIEFLRAVSAQDIAGRAEKVSLCFWRALLHLIDMQDQRAIELVDDSFRSAIVLASLRGRQKDFPEPSDSEFHFQEAITASAKVLAERISGVAVQATRAEYTVADHMNARARALRAFRAQ